MLESQMQLRDKIKVYLSIRFGLSFHLNTMKEKYIIFFYTDLVS